MRRLWMVLSAVLGVMMGLSWAASADAACTISASGVSFGSYNSFSPAPLDASGTVTYRCTVLAVSIRIDLDRGGASTFAQRQLRQGPSLLGYNLYLNAARTVVWGDGSGSTQFYSALVAVLVDVVVPVFGRIPAGESVPAGAYSDSITATILF